MNKRKIYFFSLLIITLSICYLLVTGSRLLLISLDKNNTIPLGTFITWLGLITLPLTIYWGIKEMRLPTKDTSKTLSIALKIVMVLGILWVPVSYGLAGNLSFTFTERSIFQGGQSAMLWFWRYTYGIVALALFVLILYWLSLLFKKK